MPEPPYLPFVYCDRHDLRLTHRFGPMYIFNNIPPQHKNHSEKIIDDLVSLNRICCFPQCVVEIVNISLTTRLWENSRSKTLGISTPNLSLFWKKSNRCAQFWNGGIDAIFFYRIPNIFLQNNGVLTVWHEFSCVRCMDFLSHHTPFMFPGWPWLRLRQMTEINNAS